MTLIYSGEQCYFGPAKEARQFFIDMGFDCPEQATTPDFLTSLTSPAERHARPGWEGRVPKTPKEFAAAWKASETYAQLQRDLEAYDSKYPFQGPQYEEFLASRRAQQSKKTCVVLLSISNSVAYMFLAILAADPNPHTPSLMVNRSDSVSAGASGGSRQIRH